MRHSKGMIPPGKCATWFTLVIVYLVSASCQSTATRVRNLQKSAYAYMRNDDNSNALNDINKALEYDDHLDVSYLIRGNIENVMDKYRLAISDFDSSLKYNPKNVNAFFNKGISYYLLEKNDSAAFCFTQAIECNSDGHYRIQYMDIADDGLPEEVSLLEIMFYRALSYYYASNYIRSFSDFKYCLSEKFNLKEVYLYMANIYQRYGKDDSACINYQRSLDLGNTGAKVFIDKYCK